MKKINISLIIAVIWIFVACFFFSIDKMGVGIAWLLVGVFNLIRAVWIYQMNKKNEVKYLEEIVKIEEEEENSERHKVVVEKIELSKEVHEIYDEYISYGYLVNKAFKPAESHAAEGALLCTYAPNDEYGEEGTIPYIAVQMDDEVYSAVEEYKEEKTFDGAISIEPLEGMFLFKAKRDYYDDRMYFYGFELENEEYWDKAGLCLVYPKEYIGTENEEKLMQILDEVARTFKKHL